MSVIIKSPTEIARMREAGRILEEVYLKLAERIQPGISTYEIDRIGEEMIREKGCIPTCKGYEGYPNAFCISVNDEVVHGIPCEERILEDGDIVSLDTCLSYKDYNADAARTYAVGRIDDEAKRLMDVTRQAFFEGIRFAKAGNHLNDICTAIQNYVEGEGFGIVRDLTGHGIGAGIHEDPYVPNFSMRRKGICLRPGMALAIEPMVTEGDWMVGWLEDEWTVVTMDGKRAAHYENTILITDGEPEILTHTDGNL
ncbi:methionyl aminopeptidase [[Clostridium] aminophilum]|uniref:Methionine aminopeptidase n=1 Tax=[Clostridium] aminophilum TaxID=1526 RepID=A0A1I0FZA8_9FIRM|nr:type I methionyl aminopeptidase [[Clostridium] aminophilum]SET63747.1 methionyl aminopeptidase [[Clostridium] aminophilum]